jgi:hypothetical protein
MKNLTIAIVALIAMIITTIPLVAAEKSAGKTNVPIIYISNTPLVAEKSIGEINIPLAASESDGQLEIRFPADLAIVSVQHLTFGSTQRPIGVCVTFKGTGAENNYRTMVLYLSQFSEKIRGQIRWTATPRHILALEVEMLESTAYRRAIAEKNVKEAIALEQKRLRDEAEAKKKYAASEEGQASKRLAESLQNLRKNLEK